LKKKNLFYREYQSMASAPNNNFFIIGSRSPIDFWYKQELPKKIN